MGEEEIAREKEEVVETKGSSIEEGSSFVEAKEAIASETSSFFSTKEAPVEEEDSFVSAEDTFAGVNSSVVEEKASSLETIDASFRPEVEVVSTKEASASKKDAFASRDGSFASNGDAFASRDDSFVSIAACSRSIDPPPGSIDASFATRHELSLRFETSRIKGRGTIVMTTSAKQTVTGRPIVTLGLPGVVSALIILAGAIVKALTSNTYIPNPTPSVAVLTAALAALVAAENDALTRVKGAVVRRNAARKALVQQLQLLRANVQSAADADPENALAIIESTGLTVRKTPSRKPRVFAATAGATSGTVKLVTASSGKRASYEWQYSIDGGKTWVEAPPSIQAKTVIPGLPAGTSVQFKYRAVTPKTGAENWSAPVTMLVP